MTHGVLERLFPARDASQGEIPPAAVAFHPQEQTNRFFEYALDALPCNAMFCDRGLVLRYMNRSSRRTLVNLQQYLPVRVDQMIGQSIHIFHKSPQRVDSIMGNNSARMGSYGAGMKHQLPHNATIEVGPEKLDLHVEPMIADDGEYVGAVVMWGLSTKHATDAVERVQEQQRDDLKHLTGNLEVVANASQQVETSIAEIAKDAENVARVSESSRAAGDESKAAIQNLRVSSSGVGKVAELISSIATQTSVLALNANIEAARAGMHGRGFAVVASEVRKLAEQTASATAEIQSKVAAIGSDVEKAITAIDHISVQLDEVSGLSHQMAAATEEQYAAAREMAHNIGRAAFRAAEISKLRADKSPTE